VADVQVAVRLGREAGVHTGIASRLQILHHRGPDEVHRLIRIARRHRHVSSRWDVSRRPGNSPSALMPGHSRMRTTSSMPQPGWRCQGESPSRPPWSSWLVSITRATSPPAGPGGRSRPKAMRGASSSAGATAPKPRLTKNVKGMILINKTSLKTLHSSRTGGCIPETQYSRSLLNPLININIYRGEISTGQFWHEWCLTVGR